MQKRNRDKLLQQSLYDLLVSMNEQLDKNTHCVCIMECFMQSSDAEKRCEEHQMKCGECLMSWMDKEIPF